MWQDCYSQGNEKDCENSDRRDCQWINGIELNSGQRTGEVSGNIEKGAQTTGAFITGAVVDEEVKLSPGKGACVPLFAPGFNFWEGNSEANSMCSMASAQCVVTFAAKLGGKMECKTNCECLENDWEDNMNKACIAVGDCGSSINYIGKQGYHDKSSVTIQKIDEEVDDE